jgi:hypothetical protein
LNNQDRMRCAHEIHFELTCVVQTCDFSINGTQVMRTRDARLVEGGLALVTDGTLQITVENVMLTRIKG